MVDEKGRGSVEKLLKDGLSLGRQMGFCKGLLHEVDPAVARGAIDGEGIVARPEARMSAALDVMLRAAKAEDQEIAESHAGGLQVVSRIHGPEDVVGGDVPVEGGGEAVEAVVTDQLINDGVGIFGHRGTHYCGTAALGCDSSSKLQASLKNALSFRCPRIDELPIEGNSSITAEGGCATFFWAVPHFLAIPGCIIVIVGN